MSTTLLIRIPILFSCLLGVARVASAQTQPTLLDPQAGETLPITPAGSANAPFAVRFTPVSGATRYQVDWQGPQPAQFLWTDYCIGEVAVGTTTLPSPTTAGSYTVTVQGLDSSNQPVGTPSTPRMVTLVETPAVPFSPVSSMSVGGSILATTVVVPAGVTLTATSDFKLLATSGVTIDGVVQGNAGGGPGAPGVSLVVTTASTLDVNGVVVGGNGAAGSNSTVNSSSGADANALAGGGGAGGSVTLLADGSTITIGAAALVASGTGGDGGDAVATAGSGGGTGQDGGVGRAEGGPGGAGGDLSVCTTLPGSLVVPVVPGLLRASNGGPGGNATATGGSGAPGGSGILPGVGGAYEVRTGAGGDSGNVTVTTVDWDGSGTVSPAEFAVLAGGNGAAAGNALGAAGGNGSPAPEEFGGCNPGPGKTPATVRCIHRKAGDGWAVPGAGKSDTCSGIAGVGSGKGGDVVVQGGGGGNLKRIGLSIGAFGIQWGTVTVAGQGGNASAFGGAGGPNGGDGGNASATGGLGGSGGPAPGPDQQGGEGGDATASGGDGNSTVNCCDPPMAGLIGGAGGSGSATGGDGGDSNNTGGDGGDVIAIGGDGGDGGDGAPPGAGGPRGPGNATPGAGGTGFFVNGSRGTIVNQTDGTDGAPGMDCRNVPMLPDVARLALIVTLMACGAAVLRGRA